MRFKASIDVFVQSDRLHPTIFHTSKTCGIGRNCMQQEITVNYDVSNFYFRMLNPTPPKVKDC